MNVLEKILEEIEERLNMVESIPVNEDDDFLDGEECYEDGRTQGRFKELLWCRDIIRSHMDEAISEMEKIEKEKVTSAEIITRQIDGKPYYHIKFKKVGEDEYTIGYSSFKLDYVVKWLNDYFEFYGEAKVSCDDNGWIPVQGRLPEDNHKGIYDMQLVTLEDREVCMGVYNNREKEWWTRKQEGERWYTNKHNVIAWQPLPEPYKEEKKC